jgi:hypothetical protein
MKIRNEIVVEISTEKAWEIMGTRFAQIHIWASFFTDSKPVGEKKFNEINFSGRDVVVQNGKNTHSLDIFDTDNYTLSYTVTAGAPPFADKAEAKWSLEVIDPNTCKAVIDVTMQLKEGIPGEKVTEVSQWLSQSSENMLEEFKYYLETGNLHPRKNNI